jgi:hypothetical protein
MAKLSKRAVVLAVVAVAAVIVGTALLVLAYFVWPGTAGFVWPGTAEEFRKELAKSLIQLGSITIIGGILGIILKYMLDEEARRREITRQELERRSNLYNDFIRRTGSAYRDAKSCRRELRAAGLGRKDSPASEIFSENQWQAYCAEMRKLNGVQLQLEQLKIEAGTHPDLRTAGVSCFIEKMEKYLGDLISEFEKIAGNNAKAKTATDRTTSSVTLTAVRFDQLKRLDEFTEGANGHETQRTFDTDFANAHGCVTKLLRDILWRTSDTETR